MSNEAAVIKSGFYNSNATVLKCHDSECGLSHHLNEPLSNHNFRLGSPPDNKNNYFERGFVKNSAISVYNKYEHREQEKNNQMSKAAGTKQNENSVEGCSLAKENNC